MSACEEWLERGALLIDGDTFKVRCRSTFSGTRWPDFARDLKLAVAGGLLEGAAHVEVAMATVGELWTGGALLEAIASVPNSELRTLSLGALLGEPDSARIEKSWPTVQRAFPALEHGATECWRSAANPRVRVVEVGPHFLTVRPHQMFPLAANGVGPWLALRAPAPGGTEFDSLALQISVNSSNVTELRLSPLEEHDEVRVNGQTVEVQPLNMHRNGTVLRKGTIQWFPVSGDVIEVLGLVVRYEEDVGQVPFANRQAHSMFMGRSSSNVSITLDPPPAKEEDDDD